MLATSLNGFFHEHISDYATKKYLLAVSGGMDSMIMLHLFYRQRLDIVVAHGNFQLRAEESDADEALVNNYCELLGIPFYSNRFNVSATKEATGESTQVVARKLRYNWFEDLRQRLGCDYVCTAHHQRDNVETLIQRFFQGAYPESLQGIKPVTGKVIRPLLYVPYRELVMYARVNEISFRTDSSNLLQDYTRNKIRLGVLPELESIFGESYQRGLENAATRNQYYFDFIKQQSELLVQRNRFWLEVSRDHLKTLKGNAAVLYEILKNYGFNWIQCVDICNNLNRHTGTCFENDSRTYRLYFTHQLLQLVTMVQSEPDLHLGLDEAEGNGISIQDFRIVLKLLAAQEVTAYEEGAIYFDADKFEKRELVLRIWRQGDFFTPLGMTGTKSVADFLKDKGVTPAEKDYTYVVCNGERVIGVLGFRSDENYKITQQTKRVLKISKFMDYQ